MKYYVDCRNFKGDRPCEPHKNKGVKCAGCPDYEPIGQEICIIKLGAAGDVIRTTPILRKLRAIYPHARITWVTEFPSLIPPAFVDRILNFRSNDLLLLLAGEFDLLYSLDKELNAVALASLIKAKQKKGFVLKANNPFPINKEAEHKYLTGLFDDVNRANKKHYVEEIFEICGFDFEEERYVLPLPPLRMQLPLIKGRIVGLNTGCGSRWLTRLWPEEHWKKLAILLKQKGYIPLLLGGPQEDALNRKLAKENDLLYLGTFDLEDFLHVVNLCHVVVTQVTMALHVALGLNKKVVLLNNIFNRHEFYLYGPGEIIEPPKDCLGCYKGSCNQACMELITPEAVMDMVEDK